MGKKNPPTNLSLLNLAWEKLDDLEYEESEEYGQFLRSAPASLDLRDVQKELSLDNMEKMVHEMCKNPNTLEKMDVIEMIENMTEFGGLDSRTMGVDFNNKISFL